MAPAVAVALVGVLGALVMAATVAAFTGLFVVRLAAPAGVVAARPVASSEPE